MAAFNITADPQMGDYVSLSPDSLRRQRIDVLAEKIFASMTPAQTYKLGQQRGGPDTSAGRGDSSRTIALKQAIAQEQSENAAAPTIASETVGAATAPDFDALDRSVGAQDTAKEAASFLPTAPAPTIAPETTGAAKPTATGLTGDQLTQRILDQDAALVAQEAKNPLDRLAAAPAPTVEPGTVKPTPQAVNESPLEQPRGLRLPPSEGLLKALSKTSMPPSVQPESTSTPSTGNLYQTKPLETDYGTMDWRSQTEDITPEQAAQLIGEEEAQQITEEDAFSSPIDPLATAPREDEMISRYENAAGPANDPYSLEPAPETATPEPETATPEPSFLSRLGSGMRDNPELLAQIAQAGGGFMQNIAQGRAQKKADAKTRGAMAQSNLIGALTGGKSRPAVMREEAEQGGLLARLGQAVEIGGSVAGGEMKRRTALSQRDEEMDLKGRKVAAGERQGDLMSERLGIMQDKINKEYEINNKAAQVALAKATGASYERVQGGIESLNKATNIYKGGAYLDPAQGAKNLYGQMRVAYGMHEKDPSAASVSAVFSLYQRFFDPATVREGDLKLMQEAEGYFLQLQAKGERLVNAGGSLSSNTIREMKRITDKVHSMQARKATEDVNAYISTALDPRDREATSEYYDRLLKLPSLSDSGDKGDLVKDLGQTEIKL